MSTEQKLGAFLREVSNWSWEEFVRAEHDKTYSSNEAMIFALVRSCAMQKMDAIRMSLNRLDGKLKTPIRVEYPKIFYLYPNAKLEDSAGEVPLLESQEFEKMEIITEVTEEAQEDDLPSLSLRETLSKMSDYSQEIPDQIVGYALEVESFVRNQGPPPKNIPRVKSVIVAHLLILAQGRDAAALSEVFDQIDGKLVETIQILGEDIFITSYAEVAPAGAYINENGVVQAEATVAQDLWANKLGREATGK